MYSTGPAPRESTTGPTPRESTLDVGAARLFRPCAGLVLVAVACSSRGGEVIRGFISPTLACRFQCEFNCWQGHFVSHPKKLACGRSAAFRSVKGTPMSQTEEHNPATTRWTDDHDALVGFARVLVQSNVLLSPEDVIEYFENPWYRSREHQIWHDAGRPLPPSSDDLAEARFLGSGPRANELTSKHADDTAR